MNAPMNATMNTRKKLSDLAKTIRSKNAGTDKITFDIIFRERATYEMVKRSGALTRESVCRILNVAPERLTDFVEYDPAFAIKFTILRVRPRAARAMATSSAQQLVAFLDVEVHLRLIHGAGVMPPAPGSGQPGCRAASAATVAQRSGATSTMARGLRPAPGMRTCGSSAIASATRAMRLARVSAAGPGSIRM